ncbi:NAD(P)H-binding protein [Luteipulveratus sp. YIM 133132]|uniref:NAD(P)-dependent oxidoreductase n=1 Tax=Luteipulveratus flavus TaxID=3031728 RepID=UPI0023AEF67A|nr:NAD(P)H-binding protein [Luteipulveratus sp. YIM 133132]MDE9367467.1 NAD(P)H-binding protein [Luteipulveratus sp. YIM 133132]
MARIALIGGHGKVALLTAPLLVEAGHTVDAIVRNPDHASDVEAADATAVVADVEQLDEAGTEDLLNGYDTVVWSAGAGGGDPERTYAVDRDAAIRTMDAAAKVGARRYVMVSYFGAGPDHGVPQDSSFHAYAEAKTAADAHLESTDLDWTILRPSGLTDDPATGAISVGADQDASQVSRADVAAAIAAVVGRPESARHVYEFNKGSTPVAQAFTA